MEKESVFKKIQRIGNIGSFQFNASNNFMEFSQELRFIFGFQDSITLNTMETWIDIIHPKDKEIMEQYFRESIINQNLFRKESRIIRKNDGEIRWVEGWGEIIFDDQANELSMIGVIQDITDRKLALEKIQNAEIRSHRIFESSKEGILILDAITGKITDANPANVKALT
ncbi:PAS domain-containing protein [Flavobacterium sp.]|uniref:PAS domain-containing protein n=1 Tax=Flavobacterium sp. TaxID=239 RepID=UPI0038FD0CCC